MAKKKPAVVSEEVELDNLLDEELEDSVDDVELEDSELDEDDLDSILDEAEEEEKPVKKTDSKSKKSTSKKVADKPEKKATTSKPKKSKKVSVEEDEINADDKPSSSPSRPEGLTQATEETGIITFKEGSGSAGLLILIAKFGFDKAKILSTLELKKMEGFRNKYFSRCDPAKKYDKVAGIIKKLQNLKYKMPEVD